MIENEEKGTIRRTVIRIRSRRAVNDEADDCTTVTTNDRVIIYKSSLPKDSFLLNDDS